MRRFIPRLAALAAAATAPVLLGAAPVEAAAPAAETACWAITPSWEGAAGRGDVAVSWCGDGQKITELDFDCTITPTAGWFGICSPGGPVTGVGQIFATRMTVWVFRSPQGRFEEPINSVVLYPDGRYESETG